MSSKTRRDTITRTLSNNPHAQAMIASISNEGKTDGMGFEIKHVQPGRGFSSTEYAAKEMSNGQIVNRRTFYPGPFDGAAGLSNEIKESFSVWVCWEEYRSDENLFDSPPDMSLPEGAVGWEDQAWDGPRNWYAVFDDGELAEAFALSLGKSLDDIPPVNRDIQKIQVEIGSPAETPKQAVRKIKI